MRKILLYTSILTVLTASSHDIPFDSPKWKNAPSKGPEMSTRWDMSNDLMENYLQRGKDTTEVFQLLGNQTLDCYGGKCIARYTLGPCRRGIDYGTLELTFKNGKLVDVFRHCN